MLSDKYLLIIAGPTASGKTSTGIELAKHYQTDIVSADSRQFYKEMSIGTAKPTEEEMQGVNHHFIDTHSIHENYSVGDYEKEVIPLLNELFKTKDLVILLGGSGLFIRAICEGLDHFPDVPKSILESLEEEYKNKGISFLQKELKELDPEYSKTVDLENPHRLIRALSVIKASGKPFSSFLSLKTTKRNFTPIYIQLYHEREKLYKRINQRVDDMLGAGLKEEAQKLYPHKKLKALQTVGYQEWFDHFDEKISETECIELIKRNSRRYAKRQMTWFRKRNHWLHFHPLQISAMKDTIDFFTQEKVSIESGLDENIGKSNSFRVVISHDETFLAQAFLTIYKNKPHQLQKEIFNSQQKEILQSILLTEIEFYLQTFNHKNFV